MAGLRSRLLHALFAMCLLAASASGQEPAAERPFVPPNRWAMVVGVSDYSRDFGKLSYTAKEARDFASLLTTQLGFEPANVRLIADGGAASEAPKSALILSSLDTMLADKRLDKSNLFLFYFSGHGVGTPKGDYLLPSDVIKDRIEEMGVPVEAVIRRIVSAGLKNVIFIADACRSGEENEFGKALVELCRKANIAVILGCAPGKRSYEYPQLQQGAFTHFLLEALKDPALRDESGSLWASRVANEVRDRVYRYTEPDYGKYAQTPSVWAEQTTLDVLIGSYPTPPLSTVAIKVFQTTAERLERHEYAGAMVLFAMELLKSDRADLAVEALTVVDKLDELTPAARYILGVSLSSQGRYLEAERVFDGFQAGSGGYYSDLALLANRSRTITPAARMQAATRVLKTDPTWVGKWLAWTSIRVFGDYKDQLQAARVFAAIPGQSKRQRLFSAGCVAELEMRWRNALNAFTAASKSGDGMPDNHVIAHYQLNCARSLGDSALLARVIDEGIRSELNPVECYTEKAALARERGDTRMRLDCLREALKRNPDPQELWKVAVTAGAYIRELAPEIARAAQRYPYAAKSRLLTGSMKQVLGNVEDIKADDAATDMYNDDPVGFSSSVFELLDSMLTEGVHLGRVSSVEYQKQVDSYFLRMLPLVPRFGHDRELWTQLEEFALTSQRPSQLAVLVSRHLQPSQPEFPAALRRLLLDLALNSGDSAAVRRLCTSPPFLGVDDVGWMYAAYEATQGRSENASNIVAKLPPSSIDLRPRMDALKTYLLAVRGRSREARAGLVSGGSDAVVQAFHGLAWAALGDWKKAEPLLVKQIAAMDPMFRFVTAKALRVLDQHYRAQGRIAEARTLALASASQPGNPLGTELTFAAKPGVGQFAGTIDVDCVFEDDILCIKSLAEENKKTLAFGKLNITITMAADVSGSFSDEAGNKYAFGGKLDKFGNFKGTAAFGKRRFQVAAKLAPPSLYKSFPGFKGVWPMLEMIDQDGYRVAVLGRK